MYPEVGALSCLALGGRLGSPTPSTWADRLWLVHLPAVYTAGLAFVWPGASFLRSLWVLARSWVLEVREQNRLLSSRSGPHCATDVSESGWGLHAAGLGRGLGRGPKKVHHNWRAAVGPLLHSAVGGTGGHSRYAGQRK